MSELLVGPFCRVHMKSNWFPSVGTCSRNGHREPVLKSQLNDPGWAQRIYILFCSKCQCCGLGKVRFLWGKGFRVLKFYTELVREEGRTLNFTLGSTKFGEEWWRETPVVLNARPQCVKRDSPEVLLSISKVQRQTKLLCPLAQVSLTQMWIKCTHECCQAPPHCSFPGKSFKQNMKNGAETTT